MGIAYGFKKKSFLFIFGVSPRKFNVFCCIVLIFLKLAWETREFARGSTGIFESSRVEYVDLRVDSRKFFGS